MDVVIDFAPHFIARAQLSSFEMSDAHNDEA